jgi:hypothetical protein
LHLGSYKIPKFANGWAVSSLPGQYWISAATSCCGKNPCRATKQSGIPDLIEADLAGSAVTRTARKLLQRAVDGGGLKLTAIGNLSRAVVAEMIEVIEWPDLDKKTLFELNKVINEPDVLPIHIVRLLLQETKLVRKRRDKLLLTRLGNKLLAPEQCGALQALLFHIAFWHVNLGYFDRNPIESWPQNDIGVALWSLSASANDWMPVDRLTRLCTVPTVGVLESAWGCRHACDGNPYFAASGMVRASGKQARGRGPFRGASFVSKAAAVRSVRAIPRQN